MTEPFHGWGPTAMIGLGGTLLASSNSARHYIWIRSQERTKPALSPLDGNSETLEASPPPALVQVFFEQREAMRRFFQARLGSGIDVDDLLQDLYLKAAAAGQAAQVREPRAYLYRLASNLMMDRWRSSRRSVARDTAWRDVSHVTGANEDIDDAPSADVIVAGRQRLAALMTALTRLPERTQTIFRLHKFDGLSYAEVASTLGVSRSSVEKHMMDALRALAAEVRQ